MKWSNRQFGDLDFDPDHVVEFSSGMIGFEQYKRFIIVHDEDSEPFRWLVSIESKDLNFPMLDPGLLLPGYSEGTVGAEKEVWVIAALHANVEKSTVNLRSPVVIDRKTRAAQQLILDDDSLPFQFPLVAANSKGGN